ncbi:MAG TPA: ABC transporter permease, partial [Saprospiraceae bacterium]|nr:ABC transporter permease [Saprospiraceae bacterium]
MSSTNLGIALTHLRSRKKQTMIAILGVTFGIAMFILMISFMKGTNQFLIEAMLSSTPDIRIHHEDNTAFTSSVTDAYYQADTQRLVVVRHPKPKNIRHHLRHPNDILLDLNNNPVVSSASPVLSSQIFFLNGTLQLNGIIEGVDIRKESRIYQLDQKMVVGHPSNLLSTDDGILLGQGLADKLRVTMGNSVMLFTANGQSMRFRVVGIFQFGVGIVDNVKALANIRSVQQLLGKDHGYITDIHIRLNDTRKAKQLAALFSKKYKYTADDWKTANSSVMATTIVRDVLTYVVSIALLIVAGFGIYNIMNMTITNKLKDIAILKAQGFTGKDIIAIFLS